LIAKRTTVVWFDLDCTSEGSSLPSPLQLALIGKYEDFVDFSRTHGIEIHRYQHLRFKAGSTFAALHTDTAALCYGWLTREDPFFVGEIQRAIPIRGARLIYDAFTPPPLRRKKYFEMLLQALIRGFSGERLTIFSATTNEPSLSAIRRVGFLETAVYRG
jgi:hypothetical protein